MKKLLGAAFVLTALASMLMPTGASASHHCASNVVIFQYHNTNTPAVNSNAVGCIVSPDDDLDLRVVYPGTVAITIRYTVNLGPSVASLPAVVDGLGLNNQAVTLNRVVNETLGTVVYDSARITLPARATVGGTLTATVTLPDSTTDSTCYFTVDTSCP